jgi:hypothetical protein
MEHLVSQQKKRKKRVEHLLSVGCKLKRSSDESVIHDAFFRFVIQRVHEWTDDEIDFHHFFIDFIPCLMRERVISKFNLFQLFFYHPRPLAPEEKADEIALLYNRIFLHMLRFYQHRDEVRLPLEGDWISRRCAVMYLEYHRHIQSTLQALPDPQPPSLMLRCREVILEWVQGPDVVHDVEALHLPWKVQGFVLFGLCADTPYLGTKAHVRDNEEIHVL